MAYLLTGTTFRGFSDDGTPLVGGKLYSYVSGTTTPRATYTDSALSVPHSNPITLDARGEAEIYLPAASIYTFHLTTSAGATVGSDSDGIQAADVGLRADLASTASGNGAALVGYLPAGSGAVGTTVQDALRASLKSIADFGVGGAGSSDESTAVAAMIAAHNYVYIPAGFTVQCKNIAMNDNTIIVVDGKLKLPSGCSDFDRMFYAVNKSNIRMHINEIDGNAAGQSGNIGTHLIYMTGCTSAQVHVEYIHDHYIASGATMPSVDGLRDTSSGPVFLQGCYRSAVHVGYLNGWGREGIYLLQCVCCEAGVKNALASGNTEYSGIQVGGTYNHILYATVDGAGGSAVGFDTSYGTVANVVARNTRANHGLNFGHPGKPATGSSAANIVVDGCYGNGINIQSTSADVTVTNFQVRNCGGLGLNTSDSSTNSRFTNGIIGNATTGNINALATEVNCYNVKSSDIDDKVLTCATVSGTFTEGETVTTATGSATARRIIGDLTGANRKYFLSGVTGTFSAAQTLTGGTSGATATVTTVNTPVQYSEISGGVVIDPARYFSGSVGNQYRFPDGTAIYFHSVSVALTAGTLGTVTLTYASNVLWASAPSISATIASASVTGTYTLQTLQASSTTAVGTIRAKTDVTQTYGINVIAVGRWK